jgi:beta-lactamase superfamily II metal-dependent hydrolase
VPSVRRSQRVDRLRDPIRARLIARERTAKPLTALCRRSLIAALSVLLVLVVAACDLLQGDSLVGGPSPPPSGSLSVSFIDVGQGDAVLVQAAGTNHLVDAGRPEEGPNVVDFLRSRGVRELDGIVVSNPDTDHIGGFLDVLDAFEVERVYISGDPKGTLTYNSFLGGVREEGSTIRSVFFNAATSTRIPRVKNDPTFSGPSFFIPYGSPISPSLYLLW